MTMTPHAAEPPHAVEPAANRDRETARKVLVYSDDATTRAQVLLAVGRRPGPGLPPVEFIETATEPGTIARLDAGDIDVAVLDGEAVPAGGMGICRQVKDEIYRCPPVLVLIGRSHDGWLATWSRADAVVPYPLDPIAVGQAVAGLLRLRLSTTVTTR
jgi:DNA-binding response OmpR family regulator